MNYNKKIKELKEEINAIKVKMHNDGMKSASKELSKKVLLSETEAEDKFFEIAKKKGLNLKRQYKIDIIRKKDGFIRRFYFVDFCDTLRKIVFEVDGGYHFTKEQNKKDCKRTKDIERMGYKVFRITNEQIYNGKTTQFLMDVYKKNGVIL